MIELTVSKRYRGMQENGTGLQFRLFSQRHVTRGKGDRLPLQHKEPHG